MRPLSYSQVSLYQQCPLRYKLQYIDGLKSPDRWQLSFGSTMHACAEYFFRVRVPPPPSLPSLLDFYQKNWIPAGYESAEEEAKYRAYGSEILTRFRELHAANFTMPVAVEQPFIIDVNGIKLRGFIDRVDKLDNGRLGIVDYKTDRALFTRQSVEESLQLTIYQMAAEKMWHIPVEQLTLYHLRSNTPCSCGPRIPSRLEEARQLILDTASFIAGGKFPATENEYCPCDFEIYCPYYKHKYTTESPPEQSGLSVVEAIERYASLQGQIKEMQLELEQVRQTIIDFCRQGELNRVYGREHAITYRMMEKTGYIEEEVRAVLEPLGLWNDVLGLDQARLSELIDGQRINGEAVSRLRNLKRVISSYPQLRVSKLDKE